MFRKRGTLIGGGIVALPLYEKDCNVQQFSNLKSEVPLESQDLYEMLHD